ncbi:MULTISPECIES: cupin domain-containing protein [unclassified Arthrobacter]|uniref:cupin domain-containing protein n=1 Tax=unclassified Arthrobacter TaxID=235627 RepID=UPI0037C0D9C5
MLTVVRRGDGGPTARSIGPYTGELWRDLLLQQDDGFSLGKVFFTPCGRTYWHTHPGGQLLIVEHGEGLVGDDDQTIRISAGDIVWTPPNTRHWHGATSSHSMMHTAVTFAGVVWEDELSEEEYLRAQEAGRGTSFTRPSQGDCRTSSLG